MKLCGSKFLQKNLIASGKNCFSGKCETVFSIYQKFQAAKTVSPKKETFFLPTSSFRQGETNFLSSRSKYPGKHLLVLKTSSTRLQRNNFTSSKTSWRRLGRRKIVTLKTSSRRLEDMSWRRLQHVFSVTILRLARRLEDVLEDEKLLRWRRLEDTSWRHILKAFWRHVLKTSWKHYGDKQNTYWGHLYLTNVNVYVTNLYFTNLYLAILRRIQNALIRTHHFNIHHILELKQHPYFKN